MPDPMHGMKGKREAIDAFDRQLHQNGQGRKPCRHAGRVEMPTQQWGHEVCEAKDVERARKDDGGVPVEGAADPGYLRPVD